MMNKKSGTSKASADNGFSGTKKAGQDGDRKLFGHWGVPSNGLGFGLLMGAQHIEAVDKLCAGHIAGDDDDA